MAITDLYPINISSPVQVTREQYTNVGASDVFVGDYRRAVYGNTPTADFEIWDSAVGGTQLVENTDYELTNLNTFYTNEATRNVYETYKILNPAYQATNIYITYKTIGTIVTAQLLTDILNDLASLIGGSAFRKDLTVSSGGLWADIAWMSSTQIIIKPKEYNGESFIGAVLNDGTYLEDTSSTGTIVSFGAATLDGIGALQTNSWYWLCPYEDAGGNLAFDVCFMPQTFLSSSNPTNQLNLTQLNGNDIRSLYPIGREVAIWELTTKYETPLFDTTGAAYTPNNTDMVISSYSAANQIQLNANLTVANFTSGAGLVYLLEGYEPIDCTTEAINAVIGSRGWADPGYRFFIDGSGNLKEFAIIDGQFFFDNGSGAANYIGSSGIETHATVAAFTQFQSVTVPPDKAPIAILTSGSGDQLFRSYYQTYGQSVLGSSATYGNTRKNEMLVKHNIISAFSGSPGQIHIRGYVI